ncbi:hypothetical protein [Streptomyces sp. NBC_01235]|uniref:hypothetical protein n=1 Tax=Streptomyces sp. NBC_01235 TaxID=2903788 RepID=UPI002E116A31|nr:DUF6153 family protein [Streptomyces sp. NBC_01235]
MSRYVRAGGALGHLLLVVVLALGIFAMHSMGHPGESSGSAMSTASHPNALDTAASGHDPMGAPADRGRDGHATGTAGPTSSHEPAMAMDMLSLCVAVLFGVWVLARLLRSALARHQERPAKLLAQVAAALRPDPPPRGPDLTLLSVLRL